MQNGEFFEHMDHLLRTEKFKTSLNRHIESKIGDLYKTGLSYMEKKRDEGAMMYI